MSLGRTLMVQGTSSSTGKSLLVTALCRIFRQAGVRVAPFKSQNMALNAAVTAEGLEIGRAQAVQAEAAGIEPTADMNPILLKPEGNSRSQVVVMGKSLGGMSARDYHAYKPELRQVVATSLQRLREQYELVVIEGAGSPAEINLRDHEIVNMYVARVAQAPVLLVGDIDRGGVFASFVGTLELLEPEDRARIAAFVVNKFRGDVALLQSGLDYLTRRTSIPVLGVVPHISELRIADEDSLALDERRHRGRATTAEVDIAVIRLPRIANYDDFTPLEHEPGVVVRFVSDAEDLPGADLVIVPGSKSTISDLQWLRDTGIADALRARAGGGHAILGVCGGCQMLGKHIDDPDRVESVETSAQGLGLLPLRTRFRREKTTARVRARLVGSSWFGATIRGDVSEFDGYEIHAGELERTDSSPAAFEIVQRNGQPVRVGSAGRDAWQDFISCGNSRETAPGISSRSPARASSIGSSPPRRTRPFPDSRRISKGGVAGDSAKFVLRASVRRVRCPLDLGVAAIVPALPSMMRGPVGTSAGRPLATRKRSSHVEARKYSDDSVTSPASQRSVRSSWTRSLIGCCSTSCR